MGFSNYKKETSERSDSSNWAKQTLIQSGKFYFESIEGCNENTDNTVTHLMERASVDFDGIEETNENVLNDIIKLETSDSLIRKIKFAEKLGLPLSYVLYSYSNNNVWLYQITSIDNCLLARTFDSFAAFSDWISSIKGWKSSKGYRESQDLPEFDKQLRKAGTAWPTNIDCIIFDLNNTPIGIIEFQNADNVGVKKHCNNEYYLCKFSSENIYGYTTYKDDIRRWLSQEIIRVQSGLRLFVITWQRSEKDYFLKEIEKITFPELLYDKNWNHDNMYKSLLHACWNAENPNIPYKKICNGYNSFDLINVNGVNKISLHNSPISYKSKTFPFIYYKYKKISDNENEPLVDLFNTLVTTNSIK